MSNWSNLVKQKCIQIELRQIFLKNLFINQLLTELQVVPGINQLTYLLGLVVKKHTLGPVPDNIWVAVAVSLTEHLHQPLYLLGLSRHSEP